MPGVLHVPQAGGNLISVARLIDSSQALSFRARTYMISKQTLSMQAELEGNLYYL